MTLKQFLRSLNADERARFWEKLDRDTRSRRMYIYQLSSGQRRPSPDMAMELELATGGKVAKWELRPDIWPRPKRSARAEAAA